MIIRRHFAFRTNAAITAVLMENKIKYKTWADTPEFQDCFAFELDDTHPCFDLLTNMLPPGAITIDSHIYSDDELYSAKYLSVWPLTAKVELERVEECFSFREVREDGRPQHPYFSGNNYYSRPVKHSNYQHFFSSYEYSGKIFCTKRAKELLENQSTSVSFTPVLHYKNAKPFDDLFAVEILSTVETSCLNLDSTEKYVCATCGRTSIFPPAPLILRSKHFPSTLDICKTEDIFGNSEKVQYPITLISQRIYRLLRDEKLIRGVEFEPATFCDE